MHSSILPPKAISLIDYGLNHAAGGEEARTAFTAALPLIRKAGICNAAQLGEALGGLPARFAAKPHVPDAVFPFGKHVGERVADVWRRKPAYCLWFRHGVEIDGTYAEDIAAVHDAIDAMKGGR